jgi:outer membrane protein assembly factor BamC
VTFAPHRYLRSAVCLACATLLVACTTTFSPNKIDYKTNAEVKSVGLEVPPDLTQLTRDSRYALPGNGTVSASTLANGSPQTGLRQPAVAPDRVADIQMERLGNQRWLRVQRPSEQIWDKVKSFWTENGFVLIQDNPQLGLMETEWAENRAKIPQDFIRRTLGKVLDGLYSSGERDKFRIRVERVDNTTTEIFVTHRGMEEVYTNVERTQARWQPRNSDSALEIEMLRRLMLQLGTNEKMADQAVAAVASAPANSSIGWTQGQTVLQFPDRFDVAWRRTSLALDRAGFTVEDRDRKAGLFYVRYVDRPADGQEPGFFARLFSSTSVQPPVRMRIAVQEDGANRSSITIQNESGQTDSGAIAQKIARLIYDELK